MAKWMVLPFAVGALCAAEAEKHDTRSVNVQPGGRLQMDVEYGSIEVQPGTGNRLQVDVYRKVDGPNPDAILTDFDLQVQESAGVITVRGVFPNGWLPQNQMSGGGNRMCSDKGCLANARYMRSHVYRISLPSRFHVDLKTSGGSITVGDVNGDATARTSGGSIHLGRIGGEVTARTSGGGITLAGGSGRAELKTSGGSIRIGEVSGEVTATTSGGSIRLERAGGKVIARTSGGGIEVRETTGDIEASTSGGSITAHLLRQPVGPCRLTTSGGGINVYLPRNVGVDLDASVSGGKVTSDLPIRLTGTLSERSLRGPVNNGGPVLYLRTSGGGIHLHAVDQTASR